MPFWKSAPQTSLVTDGRALSAADIKTGRLAYAALFRHDLSC